MRRSYHLKQAYHAKVTPATPYGIMSLSARRHHGSQPPARTAAHIVRASQAVTPT